MPNKEFGPSWVSGNWYCFLKYKTPKQLKKQETEIKTSPTVLPKRAMKRSKRWRKELSKIKWSCHSQKVLWDQMAKVVIYLFTYFCNIECSKIIYGFGINTDSRHTPFFSSSLFAPARLQGKWTYVHHSTFLPPKAVYSGRVLNIKPETASKTSRLAAKSPVKTPDSIYL